MGPVAAPLAASLKVSLTEVGLLSGTVFFGACLVAAWVTPGISGRIGVQRGLQVGCGLEVVGNLVCLVGPSFGWLAVGRVLVGLGIGAMFVLGAVLARDGGGVRLIGVFGGSASLGLALSLVVGGIIAETASAWRLVFVVSGTVALVTLVLLPGPIADRPAAPSSRWRPMVQSLRRRSTWRALGVYMAATCTPLVLGVWIVVYLSAPGGGGLRPWLAGTYGGLMFALTVVARPVGGWLGSPSGRVPASVGPWLPALGLGLAAGGLVGLAVDRSWAAALVWVVAIGAGFALPYAAVVDVVAGVVPHQPATGIALAQIIGSALPMAAVPAVGAALYAGRGPLALGVLGVVTLVAAAGAIGLRPAT